jgi:hypothetical protein
MPAAAMSTNRNRRKAALRRTLPSGISTIAASGKLSQYAAARELGAVVAIVTVTAELPLPVGTWAGLKLHDARAGSPEHPTLRVFGKLPVLGSTVTLNSAVLPRATETLGGVADIEKSNAGFGIAVKLNALECAVVAVSVPAAFRLNEYVCAMSLLTVIVTGTPALLGVKLVGFTVQDGGAPVPQLKFTLLLYPFMAVIVPRNVAVALT